MPFNNMFNKTPVTEWSNKQTSSVASVYGEAFKGLLIDKRTIFKSVREVSESFKEHVMLQTAREKDHITDAVFDTDHVNWSEIATTFVLNNPLWSNNRT